MMYLTSSTFRKDLVILCNLFVSMVWISFPLHSSATFSKISRLECLGAGLLKNFIDLTIYWSFGAATGLQLDKARRVLGFIRVLIKPDK